jgi:hypothetical protein
MKKATDATGALPMKVFAAPTSARLLLYGSLLSAALLGCARTVQAWPPPLTNDTPVTVRLAQPRSIVVAGEGERGSVMEVRELQGRVMSLRGETLVIRVTGAAENAAGGSIVGKRATILLDSTTVVTRSEFDSWKIGYAILATVVLIYAGLGLASD